ncbi:hypothetical protein ACFOLJ_28535 [Rugamonas sp. CCM 8940]|uniref:hypothetical protein n=1 Tax=Rugamonas sp. CCM 8940 TaxID=2765359 RepID=UPI001F16F04C|nr:hypothetical protein [Rugamonas sp. CCM 8940]
MLSFKTKHWAGRALALSVALAAVAPLGRAWAGADMPAPSPPSPPSQDGGAREGVRDGVGAGVGVGVGVGAHGGATDAAGKPWPLPAARGDDPFALAAVAAERLGNMRGGADAVWNDMKLNGAVSGNTAVNVATGANIISNGSFSSASGLPIAIQNSGANVLIQNATIINVQLQ